MTGRRCQRDCIDGYAQRHYGNGPDATNAQTVNHSTVPNTVARRVASKKGKHLIDVSKGLICLNVTGLTLPAALDFYIACL